MKVIRVSYETTYEPNCCLDDTRDVLCENTLDAIREIEQKCLNDSFDVDGTTYRAVEFNLLSVNTIAGDVSEP